MSGPGEYVADRTEGITRVEDLPKARVVLRIATPMPRVRPELLPSSHHVADTS